MEFFGSQTLLMGLGWHRCGAAVLAGQCLTVKDGKVAGLNAVLDFVVELVEVHHCVHNVANFAAHFTDSTIFVNKGSLIHTAFF